MMCYDGTERLISSCLAEVDSKEAGIFIRCVFSRLHCLFYIILFFVAMELTQSVEYLSIVVL